MAARSIFRVFLKAGRWRIACNGEVIGEYPRREEAEHIAQRMAAEVLSSQVLIYRNYGSIEKSFFNFRFLKKIVPATAPF
jgi:hypothetical protein